MKFSDKLNKDLNESSLGRIYQHIQKESVDSWAILTSYRDDVTLKQNQSNLKEIRKKIRNLGLGYIELAGMGQERDKLGKIRATNEPSFFIPSITQKQAKKLADYYNQTGFIYSGPETNDKIILFLDDGSKTDMGKFHPQKISQYYSKIRGKTFVFEKVLPTSWMEGLSNSVKERQYLFESNTKAAFFISPSGKIFPAKISHIREVIDHPKAFGLTKEYIISIYDKHKEKLGVEGKAREEILNELLSNGWTRIRRYPNKQWTINIPRMGKKIKNYLFQWANSILKGIKGYKELDKYMPVYIEDSMGVYSKMWDIDSLTKDALFNEEVKYILEWVDNSEDIL